MKEILKNNLFWFSWIITLLAYKFMYGGFHPEPVSRNFIKYYSETLVIIANLSPLYYSIENTIKNKKNTVQIGIVILSVFMQLYILW